ncbi:pilus assembly protein TadG-related protein [Microlunatus kandeliicorticis]|nr:pilus assembly protein TadG-related protein [Microlunatus kandeliicorticis]
MLNLMIMLVLLAVTAAVLGFAGYATARHQSQNAADLAALAAAQTEGSSGASVGSAGTTVADGPAPAPAPVCTAARRVARANGAEVTGCELVGSPFDFVVTVRAEVALPVHLPGLPDTVSAEANAAPVR